jgi:hypothetical protein
MLGGRLHQGQVFGRRRAHVHGVHRVEQHVELEHLRVVRLRELVRTRRVRIANRRDRDVVQPGLAHRPQRPAVDVRDEPTPDHADPHVVAGHGHRDYATRATAPRPAIAGEQWSVGRELRRRLKQAYTDERISSPYPRQVMVTRAGSAEEAE